MKSITIKGSERESVGKVSTKALRNAGMVPCVLYGGQNPVHFSAEEKSFSKLVYTPEAHTVEIDLGDKKFNGILQDIQFHPVSDKIMHIDFFELDATKEVTMEVQLLNMEDTIAKQQKQIFHIKMRILMQNLEL
jgi:large subunit ribosomal protein L25